MTQGIYKLVNNKNDKVYIGQSTNIEERFKDHMYNLINNKHHAYKLQRFYNKNHKLKSFKINYEVLEVVDNEKHLNVREQYYIQLHNSYENGYNSIGLNGNSVHTKKREQQNKKINRINKAKDKYSFLTIKYKDNLYLQYTGYNDTYLYRVNEAIKYFVKNYNLDLYMAEISQYKADTILSIIDKNFNIINKYEYITKQKCMMLNKEYYKYDKGKFSKWNHNRYKKFNNIVKSKNRYKWFLERYASLDEDIIQYNTFKYSKNKYSIPFKHIKEIIGYKYDHLFRKHIIEDKEIQGKSKKLNISYPNGRAVLDRTQP